MYKIYPGVLELAYRTDLKSVALKGLSVQIAPSGPAIYYILNGPVAQLDMSICLLSRLSGVQSSPGSPFWVHNSFSRVTVF